LCCFSKSQPFKNRAKQKKNTKTPLLIKHPSSLNLILINIVIIFVLQKDFFYERTEGIVLVSCIEFFWKFCFFCVCLLLN